MSYLSAAAAISVTKNCVQKNAPTLYFCCSIFWILSNFSVTILSTESHTIFYHGFLVHFLVLCRDSTVAPRTDKKLLTFFTMEKHIVFYHGFFENWTRFWSPRQRRRTARPSSNSASDFERTASNSLVCVCKQKSYAVEADYAVTRCGQDEWERAASEMQERCNWKRICQKRPASNIHGRSLIDSAVCPMLGIPPDHRDERSRSRSAGACIFYFLICDIARTSCGGGVAPQNDHVL